jgi:RNA polymerase sigma factor (sigma-70 family)
VSIAVTEGVDSSPPFRIVGNATRHRPTRGVTRNQGSRRARPTELGAIATDPDAFEDFYREHVEAVQRFVARRVPDPHLAADLTGEVFLAVIDSAHTYRPRSGRPIAWLFGVARNVVAAESRRSAREGRARRRVAAAGDLIDADDLTRLHARIDAEAESRHLYRAMDRLSPSERAVLELVALDGLGASTGRRGPQLLQHRDHLRHRGPVTLAELTLEAFYPADAKTK